MIVTLQQNQDSSLRKAYTGNILGRGGVIIKVQTHYKRRMTAHEPSMRNGSSSNTKSALTFILDFLAFRVVENKILRNISYSLRGF